MTLEKLSGSQNHFLILDGAGSSDEGRLGLLTNQNRM
jgi:hypothetical protein